MKTFLTIMFTLLFMAMLFTFSFAQIQWQKDANNPVFSGGAEGSWNRHVFFPCVLYNQDSMRFEMWFAASIGPSAPDWRPYRIGFATSPDGVNWQLYPDPVLEPDSGSWDASSVEHARVLREENGQYKMWYTGWSPDSLEARIGYATSPDGVTWTRDYDNNPVMAPGSAAWENGGVGYCAILKQDGIYKMWYTGLDKPWLEGGVRSQIGYATSNDGIDWQRKNDPVLTTGSSNDWDDTMVAPAHVLFINDSIYMWYIGNRQSIDPRRTGLAVSPDGLVWHKYNDSVTAIHPYLESDPVLSPSFGRWDGNYAEAMTVMQIDDTLHLWYDGSRNPTSSQLWRIGHATFASIDYMAVFGFAVSEDGLTYQFTDSSKGFITDWFWDFGDGNFSMEHFPIHTYDAGQYEVTLTVSGYFGSADKTIPINVVSDIEERSNKPLEYLLKQNYPNPFNPQTYIEYQMPNAEYVNLSVYNLFGQKVATLVDAKQPAGGYRVQWDATDFASGIYYYRIEAGDFRQVRRMLIVK